MQKYSRTMQKGRGPGVYGNYNLMGAAINPISNDSAPTMCQTLKGAGDRTGNRADRNPGPHGVYVLVRNTGYTQEKSIKYALYQDGIRVKKKMKQVYSTSYHCYNRLAQNEWRKQHKFTVL